MLTRTFQLWSSMVVMQRQANTTIPNRNTLILCRNLPQACLGVIGPSRTHVLVQRKRATCARRYVPELALLQASTFSLHTTNNCVSTHQHNITEWHGTRRALGRRESTHTHEHDAQVRTPRIPVRTW
jgi:hypothetical protein